jgi:tetratricopeptide (TPR) repeat protein
MPPFASNPLNDACIRPLPARLRALAHPTRALGSGCLRALVAAVALWAWGPAIASEAPERAPGPLPPPYRAPYVPTSDGEVLQQVPADSDPTVRALKTLRRALDDDPTDLVAADRLARAYIDFGRQLGDAHYAGYAEAVLTPWLAQAAPPAAALIDEATILQYRHQFSEARVRLKQALAQEKNNAQAWLTLATIDMVQGDYTGAARDCSQVAASAGSVLGIACSGNLYSYLGHAQQSLVLLKQIAADTPWLTTPFMAWVQGLLAETAERLGDWPEAEAHYRRALALTPKDNFLLVAYADFLLDRHRPEEVLPLLRDSAQSDTAFLRLALAKAALHSPDLPQYTWIMGARFEALAQRGSDYFGREQVRFALYLQHDPRTALDLAQRNWQLQRAPWDVRVFLEAAQAANQPQAVAAVLAFVRETKLQDPIIEPLAQRLQAQLHDPAVATR